MLTEVAAPITTEAAVYTQGGKASSSNRVKINEASATNTTGGALTLDVHVVPKGGSVGAGNQVYKALALAAGATVHLAELVGLELGAGDKITALASGAGVEISLSGGSAGTTE